MSRALLKALDFAAIRHRNQRRKGADAAPYVNHLIEVAALLADIAGVDDQDVLVAAVLHDVVEDTGTSAEDVGRLFGERVRQLVENVTDDKSLPKEERRRLVLEHLEHADVPTKLVKLADLCSNIALLPSEWSDERQRAYIDWSSRAAALCAGVNAELEQLYQERLNRTRTMLRG